MQDKYFDPRDAKNALLHTAISTIERELAGLPAAALPADDAALAALRASWRGLVTLLALEPVHAVRVCPSCKTIGMRAASRCSNCWTKLEPIA